MALIDINLNPDDKQLKNFGRIWAPALFALLGAMSWFKTGSTEWARVFGGIAALVFVVGLVFPRGIRPLWIAIMAVTFPIGLVISNVLLLIMFYLVFTPVGLLMRVLGKDPMARAWDQTASTYWVKRAPVTDTARYFKQF